MGEEVDKEHIVLSVVPEKTHREVQEVYTNFKGRP